MDDKQNICGAKTRSGGRCQKAPCKDRKRCSNHGGKTPRGVESPHYKSGLYSQYAGDSLKKVLDDLEDVDPEELTRVSNELRLMTALIIKSKALEGTADDLDDLDTISKVIERLVKSKQRAVALNIEENRLVPVSDIEVFLDYVETTLERYTDQSYEIMTELQSFKISDQ